MASQSAQFQDFLFEVETQIIISEKLRYCSTGRAGTLLASAAEVSRILSGLIESLKKSLAAAAVVD